MNIRDEALHEFLDRYAFIDSCKKCGGMIFMMITGKHPPTAYNDNLEIHLCVPKGKKPTINEIRRSPGGEL